MLGHGPAVVVGHSLGARNAWVFAAEHPDAVLGVVAVDYTPFIEGEVLDTLERRVAAGDRRFADVAEIESYLAKRYPRMPRTPSLGELASGTGTTPTAACGRWHRAPRWLRWSTAFA